MDETATIEAPAAPPADTLDIPEPRPAPDSVPASRPRLPRRRRNTPGADKTPKPPTTPKARPATRRSKAPKIGESMAGLYAMAGMGLSAIPSKPAKLNPDVSAMESLGQVIVANSAACGAAWEKAAEEDPRIAAALERVLVASAFSQLFAAHLPILLVASVNAGVVPLGVAALMSAAVAGDGSAEG